MTDDRRHAPNAAPNVAPNAAASPDRSARTARPRAWRTLARGLADLLLPRACAVCHEMLSPSVNGVVCGTCWSRMEPFPEPSCGRCGYSRQPLPGVRLTDHDAGAGDGFADCRWCLKLPSTVRAVRSAARLDAGTASALVHALKYSGWTAVADGMGARMARLSFPRDVESERVALIPIPLGAARLRERGFNQSLLLAQAVARRWDIPVWDDVLGRQRETDTQTRLTPSERASNVSGAFGTTRGANVRLRGAHLVLVDDVITTAATLNAAAAALSAGGARILSYLTFGRAPDSGERSSHVSDPD